jgi:hypothetical protein
MKIVVVALSSAFVVASSASAQTPGAVPVVKPAVAVVAGQQASVLRAGTPIALKVREELTTKGKNLRVGQRFQLEVAEPVTVNGQVVIPLGSPAMGEVTHVRNKGMWGKSGGINARVLYVRANGQQIRLTGQVDDKGKTGTAGVVGAIAFVPVAGFFVTGTSAIIPLGAPVNAFIDEDVPLVFAQSSAPASMMVVPEAAAAPVAPAVVQASSVPQPKK